MSNQWRQSVNQPVGPARIADINKYIIKVTSERFEAPIDFFYITIQDMMKVTEPDFLQKHPSMGPLLLVGLVSATENYFRDLFARIIRMCPISQACSSEQSVSLGSVFWHGNVNPERGAFENISFAATDSLKRTCKRYLNYEPDKTKPTAAVLEEFDKVCEMRHCIVHSGSGKNAARLKIGTSEKVLKIKLGYNELQETTLICTTLVASFNSMFKFSEIRSGVPKLYSDTCSRVRKMILALQSMGVCQSATLALRRQKLEHRV